MTPRPRRIVRRPDGTLVDEAALDRWLIARDKALRP